MLTGISIWKSIDLFGHMKSSNQSDYRRVLDKLGVEYGKWSKVDNRKKWDFPKKCMIRIQYGVRRTGHLVAYYNGKIYDPLYGVYDSVEEFINDYNNNRSYSKVRIDGYMEVFELDTVKSAGGA
jgi:hypothetical protein